MKRLLLVPIALTALLAGSGCTLKGARIPQADIPFAKADYKVLGETNAQECGTYAFGIDWGHLFKNERASSSGGGGGDLASILVGLIPSGMPPEGSRALYYALEKMPEATHLLAPRVQTTTQGVLLGPVVFFGKRCASVTAHGVKIGNGPTTYQ
jgi:hypothetical protein